MKKKEMENKRFELLSTENINSGNYLSVIKDRKTDVQYLVVATSMQSVALTVLVDKDGKPLINNDTSTEYEIAMDLQKN